MAAPGYYLMLSWRTGESSRTLEAENSSAEKIGYDTPTSPIRNLRLVGFTASDGGARANFPRTIGWQSEASSAAAFHESGDAHGRGWTRGAEQKRFSRERHGRGKHRALVRDQLRSALALMGYPFSNLRISATV